jgi:hypothetical protein
MRQYAPSLGWRYHRCLSPSEVTIELLHDCGMSDQCIETFNSNSFFPIISSQMSLKTWRNEPQILVLQIRTTFPTNRTKNANSHAYGYTLGFSLPNSHPKCPSPMPPTNTPDKCNAQNSLSSDHLLLSHITTLFSSHKCEDYPDCEKGNQRQIHSAKTHHLALLSASTSPLQTPRSPTLMIVSQVPPSPLSVA